MPSRLPAGTAQHQRPKCHFFLSLLPTVTKLPVAVAKGKWLKVEVMPMQGAALDILSAHSTGMIQQ